MANCPRCDGLLVEEWNGDEWQQHCLNCGGVMPRFLSEKARQSYVLKCAEARAARKRKAPVTERVVSLQELDAAIDTLQRVRQLIRQDLVHA